MPNTPKYTYNATMDIANKSVHPGISTNTRQNARPIETTGATPPQKQIDAALLELIDFNQQLQAAKESGDPSAIANVVRMLEDKPQLQQGIMMPQRGGPMEDVPRLRTTKTDPTIQRGPINPHTLPYLPSRKR